MIDTPDAARAWADATRAAGRTIALAPTMGALHRGHLELIDAARRHADRVVVSIFVNPLQFGEHGDFDQYPRPLDDDLLACEAAGVDAVYVPTAAAMYPAGFATTVHVVGLSDTMEGGSRPGHFDGVCTVVLKLFLLTGCDVAVFGEKDFQQLAVIRRMVRDLDVPVEIVPCPTVREADGLAMSSRNTRLTPVERADAPRIRQALLAAATLTTPDLILKNARAAIEASPLARIDYLSLVDAETLLVASSLARSTVLATAVFYGVVRLIDHISIAPCDPT